MKRMLAVLATGSLIAFVVADRAPAQCAGDCAGESESFGDGSCDVGGCVKKKCRKAHGKSHGKPPRCKTPRCKRTGKHACKSCRGGCESSCGYGCDAGAGGCDAGGCAAGGSDGVLYGGEYPSETPSESYGVPIESHGIPIESQGIPPAPDPVSVPNNDSTTYHLPQQSHVRQVSFRDVSSAALAEGLHLFWDERYTEAEQALTDAAKADPHNVLTRYMLALSLRRSGQAAAADAVLSDAIEAEKQTPIASWGTQMQRVQGADRIWLEDARYAAGL
ncbi:MAG: tetratricopeptide repeat protein [Pirellulales bacterium]